MNKNIKGMDVIIEALFLINKIYKTIKTAERIKNVFLKTLIIERECFKGYKNSFLRVQNIYILL